MNFDNKLNKVLNDEINIPESILKKKDIAFEEIRKSKKKKKFGMCMSMSMLIYT